MPDPLLKFFASQDAHRRARAAVKQRYKVKSLATAKAVATEGIPVGARVAFRAAQHQPEHPAEFTVLSWEEVPRPVDRPAGAGWVALAGAQGDVLPAQAADLADYPAVTHRWTEDRPFVLYLSDERYPENERRYETYADAEDAARDLTAKKIAFRRQYPMGVRPENPVARASAMLLQVWVSDVRSEESITTTLDALVNTSRFGDEDLLAGLTEAVLALPEPTEAWTPASKRAAGDDASGALNWHETLRIHRLRVPAAQQPLLVGTAATPQSHERSLLVYSSTLDEEGEEDDYGEPLDTYTMDAFVMLHSDRPALIGALRSGEEEVRVDGVLYHANFDDFRSIARRGGDRVRALPGEEESFFRRADGEMVPLAALVEKYGDRADLVGKLRAAAPGLSVDAEGAIFERCSRPDTCRPLVPAGQGWTDELLERQNPSLARPDAQQLPLVDGLSSLQAAALHHALHQVQGAAARWAALRTSGGATDEDLRTAIATEFGILGGSSGPGQLQETHRGGRNPHIEIGATTLKGSTLLRAVRALLHIPKPPLCPICHQPLLLGHLAAQHVLETERRLLQPDDPHFGDRGLLRDTAIRELRISRPASALLVLLAQRLRERVRAPVHDYLDRRRPWMLMQIHEALLARGKTVGAGLPWRRFADELRDRLLAQAPSAPAAYVDRYLARREPALRLLLASAREGFLALPTPQPGTAFVAYLATYGDVLRAGLGRTGREVVFADGESIILPREWPVAEGAPLRLYPRKEWVGEGPTVRTVSKLHGPLRHRDVVHLALLRWRARLDDTDLAEMARSWGYQEARHGTTPTDFAPVARILDAGSLARVELVRSAFLKGMQEAAAGAAAALS